MQKAMGDVDGRLEAYPPKRGPHADDLLQRNPSDCHCVLHGGGLLVFLVVWCGCKGSGCEDSGCSSVCGSGVWGNGCDNIGGSSCLWRGDYGDGSCVVMVVIVVMCWRWW